MMICIFHGQNTRWIIDIKWPFGSSALFHEGISDALQEQQEFFLAVYLGCCYWTGLSYVLPNAERLLAKPLEWLEAWFHCPGFHDFMHCRSCFHHFSSPTLRMTFLAALDRELNFRVQKYDHGSERKCGFAQLLAIFLIGILILNGLETYYSNKIQEEKRQDQSKCTRKPGSALFDYQ